MKSIELATLNPSICDYGELSKDVLHDDLQYFPYKIQLVLKKFVS